MEADISFLHGSEGRKISRRRINGCTYCLETLVDDPPLEPMDLEGLSQWVYSVLLQVVMLNMSLDMEGNVLVERKTTPLAFKAETLEFGYDGCAGCYQLLATQKLGMEGSIGFTPILGLSCYGSGMSPGLRGPPYGVEDIVHPCRVLNKGLGKRSLVLKDIQRLRELVLVQVDPEDRGTSCQLGVDGHVRAVGFAKSRWVFWGILR